MKKSVIIAAFVILLASLSLYIINTRPTVVGEWEAEISVVGLNDNCTSHITMIFNDDGSGEESFEYTNSCKAFSYEINKNHLRLDYGDGSFDTFDCYLEKDKLTLTSKDDDRQIVFIKK